MFPVRLKMIRQKRGFSQEEMAEKLEISSRSYQRYEAIKGYCAPPLDTLINIADLLDVSTDYLLGRDDFLKSHGVSVDECL